MLERRGGGGRKRIFALLKNHKPRPEAPCQWRSASESSILCDAVRRTGLTEPDCAAHVLSVSARRGSAQLPRFGPAAPLRRRAASLMRGFWERTARTARLPRRESRRGTRGSSLMAGMLAGYAPVLGTRAFCAYTRAPSESTREERRAQAGWGVLVTRERKMRFSAKRDGRPSPHQGRVVRPDTLGGKTCWAYTSTVSVERSGI